MAAKTHREDAPNHALATLGELVQKGDLKLVSGDQPDAAVATTAASSDETPLVDAVCNALEHPDVTVVVVTDNGAAIIDRDDPAKQLEVLAIVTDGEPAPGAMPEADTLLALATIGVIAESEPPLAPADAPARTPRVHVGHAPAHARPAAIPADADGKPAKSAPRVEPEVINAPLADFIAMGDDEFFDATREYRDAGKLVTFRPFLSVTGVDGEHKSEVRFALTTLPGRRVQMRVLDGSGQIGAMLPKGTILFRDEVLGRRDGSTIPHSRLQETRILHGFLEMIDAKLHRSSGGSRPARKS